MKPSEFSEREPSSRRRQAAWLFDRGRRQVDVARELGVSRVTAMQWHRLWLLGGAAALTAKKPRGRRARLNADHERQIHDALMVTPTEVGLPGTDWSIAAVAALIEKVAGVRYHPRHVSRLLRRMGWEIPPFGKHRERAMRVRRVADPDGNSITLEQKRCDFIHVGGAGK